MTYYQTQVLKLNQQLYSKEHSLERIKESKRYIDQHFASHLHLDELATKAFLSKYHFIRLFKKIYGKTPWQYLVTVRIRQAKKLLTSGLPVAEVCFAVGFDSTTSFAALFRKMTGFTPSAFRAKKSNFKELSS